MMSFNQELQQYLHAAAAARHEECKGIEDLRKFIDCHLGQNCAETPSNASASSITYMESLINTVEFFTEFCVLLFARSHGAPYNPPGAISQVLSSRPRPEKHRLLQTCLPLSMWNKHRIRRALLRFQLYCELFHQPGDSTDRDDDWEDRIPEQEFFWLRYEWWEIEEVKCIYQLLLISLEHTDVGSGQETESSFENPLPERGLLQLRPFLDGTKTTSFGRSCLRRFLSKAFHGFSKADPEDFNYFSQPRPPYDPFAAVIGKIPPGSYRTLERGRRRNPSPYPGARLEVSH